MAEQKKTRTNAKITSYFRTHLKFKWKKNLKYLQVSSFMFNYFMAMQKAINLALNILCDIRQLLTVDYLGLVWIIYKSFIFEGKKPYP